MTTNDEFESPLDDEMLDEGLSEASASEPSTGRDARRQRLEDYETGAQTKDDDLQALLTFANSDLLAIAFALAIVVKDSLANAPLTTESARQVEPALNDLLRVHRQASLFAQLDVSITKARLQAEDAKSRSRSTAMFGHTPQTQRWPR